MNEGCCCIETVVNVLGGLVATLQVLKGSTVMFCHDA